MNQRQELAICRHEYAGRPRGITGCVHHVHAEPHVHDTAVEPDRDEPRFDAVQQKITLDVVRLLAEFREVREGARRPKLDTARTPKHVPYGID